jgi:DNA replication and repair protein RecF
MRIALLKLQNFRNYKNAEFSFSPQINVFWGNNGQGKTNLLEAIHVLSTGRSFRTHRLQDMVLQGETYFYIEAQFIKDDIVQSLKIYYDNSARKVIYNETVYPHFSSLLGILPSVLLSPDDLVLINGSPAERRRFLDLHIAQIDPLYLFYLSRYYKAMKQRNELLRRQSSETLNAWEQVMAPAASYLMAKRKQATELLQESCSQWMKLFSQGEDLDLSYNFFLQDVKEEEFQSKLSAHWQNTRHKEMQYGTTTTGPHRDDISILHCGKEARHFSSEGQKRSCIASLRFAQWEHMKKWTEASPLLAIDDFGIQLDAERQNQLKEQIAHFGQVFLTSPHPIAPITGNTAFQAFHVQQGQII